MLVPRKRNKVQEVVRDRTGQIRKMNTTNAYILGASRLAASKELESRDLDGTVCGSLLGFVVLDSCTQQTP